MVCVEWVVVFILRDEILVGIASRNVQSAVLVSESVIVDVTLELYQC